MTKRIDDVIFENLISNDVYARKVLPFLKSEYFGQRPYRIVFDLINEYFMQYNKLPTQLALTVDSDKLVDVPKDEMDAVQEIIGSLKPSVADEEWLLNSTEKFCKDRAIYNAIMDSIKIIEGKDKKRSVDSLSHLMEEAISVTFDKSVGHDYIMDAKERYEYYHSPQNKIPFDLELFNKITKGGVSKKTLNIVLAPTGVGKSFLLCHLAAGYLKAGKNVLYISMEMAEEELARRIDCNVLNVTPDELDELEEDDFISKVNEITKSSNGILKIKEYPNNSAHVGHFKSLINELKRKQNFIPDAVIVDYLNICASQRLKNNSGNVNSYTLVKTIVEELRAMAVELKVPVWSATQTNREGANNSDISLKETSDSFGSPMTADFFFAMVRTEELDNLNQCLIIQLKSRYNNIAFYRKFVVGMDLARFRLYDAEESAQADLVVDEKYTKNLPNPVESKGYDFDFE